MFPQAILC